MTILAPRHDELIWPTLKALKDLGGSASIQELLDQIIENEQYSEEVQNLEHKSDPRGKLGYNAAWARTYLKNYDAIENSSRGVWVITEKGEKITEEEASNINKIVKSNSYNIGKTPKENDQAETTNIDEETEIEDNWKAELLSVVKNIEPDAFERLAMLILRESGFIKVQVTGKTGDGGIDGVGILRVNLISFHVSFQCKRYQGSVGSRDLRDFRGAMVGRGDKGLFITTGSFTSEARKEANRDGAPAIDLIDGNELCDILKRLSLGVKTEKIEKITINDQWFKEI